MEEIRELKERLERERPVEWEAFPDIGLYMDQLISYMPRQLIHYGEGESLTSAMVNNYIKDGAMPRAEGKRYSRTHLAYLTALCALRTRGCCWLPRRRGGRPRSCTNSFGRSWTGRWT